MAVKSTNKASSSKRTSGSAAKTSTIGPKPASPRTRAQKIQEAAAVVPVQVDENFDPSTAMEVTPRYVKVPFGRTSRMNYQQARASAVRKYGLPQPPTTPAPTAMNQPPLTMFDAPTKVVLPSVARRVSRTPTQPDMDTVVATPNDNGGETDKGEETDAEAPQTPANGQSSGDATVTEDATESRDDEDADTPSSLSVAVEVDGDAPDIEGETAPSTPTPVSRNVQHETTMDDTTSLTPLQPLVDSESEPGSAVPSNNVPSVASEPQSFGGVYDSYLSVHQNPDADIWNNPRTAPSAVDLCPTASHCTAAQQWNIPTVDTYQQLLPCSITYQSYNTVQPLARTGTDFDLAARLNQLNVQATYLPNGFEGYAQVHPDTVHFQGLSASAPARAFQYERPDALPPFSSIWPQSLGLYYSGPVSFQHAGMPAPQTYQFYPQAPQAIHLHQSAPASCPSALHDRAYAPTIRTGIHKDPQPEWQGKIEEISEGNLSDLAQEQNPFQRMIGKRGPLYITKAGEEEPRKFIPLPARVQANRVLRPVKGSEEDLIERIERDRQLEVQAARRLEKKAAKQLGIEAKESHPAEKKAEKLARKSAKRDKHNSDKETSDSARSERPAKKQKTSN